MGNWHGRVCAYVGPASSPVGTDGQEGPLASWQVARDGPTGRDGRSMPVGGQPRWLRAFKPGIGIQEHTADRTAARHLCQLAGEAIGDGRP